MFNGIEDMKARSLRDYIIFIIDPDVPNCHEVKDGECSALIPDFLQQLSEIKDSIYIN